MINTELMKVACPDKLIEMGFVEENDGSGDPRGVDWNMKTENFHVRVDPWFEVQICRLKPYTDFITLHVEDLSDLQSVIDWIADEE